MEFEMLGVYLPMATLLLVALLFGGIGHGAILDI